MAPAYSTSRSRTPVSAADLVATKEIHDRLIQPTLRNALKTRLYRSLWDGIDVASLNVNTLSTLPLTRKEALREASEDAQIRKGLICDEVFSSGTTGQPFITVR